MKCPIHNIEMTKIAETVNASYWTDLYWLCDGNELSDKHIVKTQVWINTTTFYTPNWTSIKTVKHEETTK